MAPQESFKDTYTQYIRNKQYFATIRINENTKENYTQTQDMCNRNIDAFRNIRKSLSKTELKFQCKQV